MVTINKLAKKSRVPNLYFVYLRNDAAIHREYLQDDIFKKRTFVRCSGGAKVQQR